MTAIHVKICGITHLEDGLAALQAGAGLLGFNFHQPSPRCLAAEDCARLVAALRASGYGFQAVGIFVNQGPDEIEALLERCGLDLAQLSGDEPPTTLAALGERSLKALRPADVSALNHGLKRYPPRPSDPAYLIDSYRPGEYGGMGQIADWSLASGLAERYPILLAGGLTPANVAQAIRQVRPWGVDVASGVESSPGHKDPAKIAAFIQACQEAASIQAKDLRISKEYNHAQRPID